MLNRQNPVDGTADSGRPRMPAPGRKLPYAPPHTASIRSRV